MSDWNNLDEIMQDLSVAQGHYVPASLETYSSSERPAFNVEEEIDENPYYEPGGGGDYTAPDCGLIQKMLNMVKEKKDGSDDDSPGASSDLDPMCREFVPQHIQAKIKRNVALSSIISAKESALAAKRPMPKDVICTMFKRKNVNHSTDVKSDTVSPQTTSPDKFNQYTPSTRANEYYNKYLEKSKLKEQFEEDIWSQAERKMKEIEARNKLEAERASAITEENAQTASLLGISPRERTRALRRLMLDLVHENDSANLLRYKGRGFEIVCLPQHRHQLTGKCLVCSIASNHGYEFKN